MHFSILLAAFSAVAATATSTSNTCLQGAIGKYQSMKSQPCVQLYCSKRLWPSQWKTKSPDWAQTLTTCNYAQVESSLNSKLGSQADGYCKCAKGLWPSCPTGKVRTPDYSTCMCDVGTVDNGKGGCCPCTSPKVPSQDRKSCVCSSGMDTVGSTCKAKCRSDQTRNPSSGQCGCTDSTKEELSGACVAKCRSDQTRNASSGKCDCKDTAKEELSGACVSKCRSDQTRSTSTGQCGCTDTTKEELSGSCVAKCRSDQTRSASTGNCECRDSTKEEVSGTCKTKCSDTQQRYKGNCVAKCRDDQIRNNQGDCECDSSSNLVEYNGACKTRCNDDEERNTLTGECQCLGGKLKIDGSCQFPERSCPKVTDPYPASGSRSFHKVCGSTPTKGGAYLGRSRESNFQSCLDTCVSNGLCVGVVWLVDSSICGRLSAPLNEQDTASDSNVDRAVLIPCRSDQERDSESGQCQCPGGEQETGGTCPAPRAQINCADVSEPYTAGSRSFHKVCGSGYTSQDNAFPRQTTFDYKGCLDLCAQDSQCTAFSYQAPDHSCYRYSQTPSEDATIAFEDASRGYLIDCRTDQQFDLSSGKCTCADGQQEIGGICRTATCDDFPSYYTDGSESFSLTCSSQFANIFTYYATTTASFAECVHICAQDTICMALNFVRTSRACTFFVVGAESLASSALGTDRAVKVT